MADQAQTNSKEYQLKNNEQVDKRIDDWIKEKPDAYEKIRALIKDNPDRAARQIVNNRINIADLKAEKQKGLSNYKAAVREVIDKTLGEKKHQTIAKNLDQRYPSRATDQKQGERFYREAESTLRNIGEPITEKASATLAKQKVEKAKSQGIKV